MIVACPTPFRLIQLFVVLYICSYNDVSKHDLRWEVVEKMVRSEPTSINLARISQKLRPNIRMMEEDTRTDKQTCLDRFRK